MTFTGETLGLSKTKNLFLGETKHLVKLHILPSTSKWVKNVDQLIKKIWPVWHYPRLKMKCTNTRIPKSHNSPVHTYQTTNALSQHWGDVSCLLDKYPHGTQEWSQYFRHSSEIPGTAGAFYVLPKSTFCIVWLLTCSSKHDTFVTMLF